MKEIKIEELKAIQVNILKNVDVFCTLPVALSHTDQYQERREVDGFVCQSDAVDLAE